MLDGKWVWLVVVFRPPYTLLLNANVNIPVPGCHPLCFRSPAGVWWVRRTLQSSFLQIYWLLTKPAGWSSNRGNKHRFLTYTVRITSVIPKSNKTFPREVYIFWCYWWITASELLMADLKKSPLSDPRWQIFDIQFDSTKTFIEYLLGSSNSGKEVMNDRPCFWCIYIPGKWTKNQCVRSDEMPTYQNVTS